MNTELFIAKRLIKGKENKKNISGTILKVALTAIAISVATIILSVSVVRGFKLEIAKKVVGFGSHIQITNFDSNISYETNPISKDESVKQLVSAIPGVENVQPYAIKAGIIKTREDIYGIVAKGIDEQFNWDFFAKNMKKGNILESSDTLKADEKIVISQHIADKLKIDVGDKVAVYFPEDPPRMRALLVHGIYDTDLEVFDKLFVLTDLGLIQRLNDWDSSQISGYEVLLNDLNRLETTTSEVKHRIGNIFYEDGSKLRVDSIKERYPQIFDWLGLLDMNAIVLISLILLVAGINMISGLVVIILERVRFIGILKSLGSTNRSITDIFLYFSGFLVLKGMLWGNVAGISIALLQKYFGFIKLEESSYYLSTVPIYLNFLDILLINAGTLLVIVLMLFIPSGLIARISPEKSIRFT